MILDDRLEFADAAAIALTIGNAIAPNTDVIDLAASSGLAANVANSPNALLDIGVGERLYLVIQVTTTFVGATATIAFDLVSDSAAALTTSKTTHLTTGAIAVATWAAGYTRVYALPQEKTYERYLGLWMTVATANVTAGAINAFLVRDPSRWIAYSDQDPGTV